MSAFVPLSRLLQTGRSGEAVVAYGAETPHTWSDFVRRVGALAARLDECPEKRWALCCRDAYAFSCAFFALLHSNKRVVIPPNFQPGALETLSEGFDGVVHDEDDSVTLSSKARVLATPQSASPRAFAALDPENSFLDLYTSGTSAAPKRITKRLAQLEAEIAVLENQWGATLAGASVLGTVPHHHIYGLLFRLLWPLACGSPFDALPLAHPHHLLQRLRQLGNAAVVSSPAQLSRMNELIDLTELAPACRIVFSSGGPLSPAVAAQFHAALGWSPTEIYGSTETGGIAWRRQSPETGKDDAWTPLPGIAVRLCENQALRLSSPFLDETVREAGGWLELSDAAEMLPNGRFRLKGRLDRVVKIEEKRVSLTELEERLKRHPWVVDAGVTSLPGRRQILGTALVLSASGREAHVTRGKPATVASLRRYLADYFEPVLLPRRWRFLEQLPLNERGKLSSAELGALFAKIPRDRKKASA